MIKKALHLIPVTVSGYISIQIYDHYHHLDSIDPTVIMTMALLLGLFCQIILDAILNELPQHIKFIRKYLDEKYRIEGCWFEYISNVPNPYSIAFIIYKPADKKFIYYGYNYLEDLQLFAKFESTDVQVEDFDLVMKFNFHAALEKTGESITGFGRIKFDSDGNFRIIRGHGHFIDSGTELRKHQMRLFRIPLKMIRATIGKGSIQTEDDFIKLINESRIFVT